MEDRRENRKKVVVTGRIPKDPLKRLERDFEVIYPKSDPMGEKELLDIIPECDAVITVFGRKFPDKAITEGSRLRIISNYGGGVDNINIPLATERGVVVTNTPDTVTSATAEMAMALLLSLARRVSECDRKLRSESGLEWGLMKNLGTTLRRKRAGIIGMGRIGKAIARLALPFGIEIAYHNRNRVAKNIEQQLNARYSERDDLMRESDIIFISTPLTESTRSSIGEREFKMMKSEALFINTSRGEVVDEEALIKALENGEIAGAGLDVFADEPNISPGLLEMDNVVLTPHTGTGTDETREQLSAAAADNIIGFFRGDDIPYILNPEALKV